MKRIETLSDLKRGWSDISQRLAIRLTTANGLRSDPRDSLRQVGYDLSDDAFRCLMQALAP